MCRSAVLGGIRSLWCSLTGDAGAAASRYLRTALLGGYVVRATSSSILREFCREAESRGCGCSILTNEAREGFW